MISSSTLSELQSKLRKPHVNSTCISCSACTMISPDVFVLWWDEMKSCVQPLDSYEWKDVDDAIAACPVYAISWQEMDADRKYIGAVVEHQDIA